jgi:GT2 family glycosyltransferase
MGNGVIMLACLTCGHVLPVTPNIATGILCGKCGGSLFSVDGDDEQYSLSCPKCKKEFLIDRGKQFNCREFSHCNLHIFSFSPVLYVRKEQQIEQQIEQQLEQQLKKQIVQMETKNKSIISYPICREAIENIKALLPRDKKKIGIITGSERDHILYEHNDELIEELKKKYHIFIFDSKLFTQENFVEMNESDLVIGQYTNTLKYAFILRIPTIVIHTEVNIPYSAEVVLFGQKKHELSLLLQSIEDVLSKPSLSYCIVTYNRKDITKECLDAIYKYKRTNEDVIIIDNASIDGIKEILKGGHNTSYIFNKSNIGCTLARNAVMRIAQGRTLLVLDSDQIIVSDTVHKMRLCGADIVGSEGWAIDKNGITQHMPIEATNIDYVGAGGMMISKQKAEALNYFDEQFVPGYYEDPDFCIRAKNRGYTIEVCDSGIIHKGPGMDKALGDKTKEIKDENRKKFITKWTNYNNKAKATSTRPSILMLVDVPAWAWDVKAKNIQKYLADDYNIQIRYQHEYGDFVNDNFDIYFVFDCIFVRRLAGKASNRIIGGVTAHTYVNFDGYKELLKRCGAVHANSMLLYEEAKQLNPNVFYTPNGVDEKLFKFVDRDAREIFRVGYVGKSHDRKGFNNFIVPACQKAGADLRAQTSKYNEKDKIDPSDMPEFYKGVDCVVIASDMDGTPNQLLEAAATGRTFVGVPIGNVPEFHNSKNGFIVERKIDAIAEKIEWLKKHRKQCKIMGIEARKTIEAGWAWKQQSQNYKKLFDFILSNLS